MFDFWPLFVLLWFVFLVLFCVFVACLFLFVFSRSFRLLFSYYLFPSWRMSFFFAVFLLDCFLFFSPVLSSFVFLTVAKSPQSGQSTTRTCGRPEAMLQAYSFGRISNVSVILCVVLPPCSGGLHRRVSRDCLGRSPNSVPQECILRLYLISLLTRVFCRSVEGGVSCKCSIRVT